MKQLILLSLVSLLYLQAADVDFSLDANGITILCPNAVVDESETVDGIIYTKIDGKDDLIVNAGLVDATEACTSGVTNMDRWFSTLGTFDKDIGHLDTSSVTTMYSMFYRASAFNQDISSWDTSKVTNMGDMFNQASSFDQDISQWCVSNIVSKPDYFDTSSAFVDQDDMQPQWGTCPLRSLSAIYYLLF